MPTFRGGKHYLSTFSWNATLHLPSVLPNRRRAFNLLLKCNLYKQLKSIRKVAKQLFQPSLEMQLDAFARHMSREYLTFNLLLKCNKTRKSRAWITEGITFNLLLKCNTLAGCNTLTPLLASFQPSLEMQPSGTPLFLSSSLTFNLLLKCNRTVCKVEDRVAFSFQPSLEMQPESCNK